MKKKKKKYNKKKLIIKRMFLFVILIILAIICFFVFQKEDTQILFSGPMRTLSEYVSYINEGDYEKMYDMISTSSKNKVTKEAFIEKNKTIYEQLEAKNVDVSDMKEEEENRKNEGSIYKYHGYNSWKCHICKYRKTCKRRTEGIRLFGLQM